MAKTLSKKERKDMIRTLKGAALLIERGEKNFICNAISHYSADKDIHWGIEEYLHEWISDMLGYYSDPDYGAVKIITLNEWNDLNKGIIKGKVTLKQDRLHWIDWMINELKSEKA